MNDRIPTTLMVAAVGVAVLGVSSPASAATPTYWDNRVDFEASLTESVLDDYSNAGYLYFQNDGQMSDVLGETDYVTTGFTNSNYVLNIGFDPYYCAGCYTFELSFTDTSVGSADGVNAVGFEIINNDVFGTPYYAYITFGDGTTEDYLLPGAGVWWAVSAPENIERMHIGLSGGLATTFGFFYMDDLIIGRQLCGNGVIDPDEQCDDDGETLDCDANCTFVSCGDGDYNLTAGEQCDTGGDSQTCNFDCTTAQCGDLYINAAAGELCDDGTGENEMCDADCTAAMCGDATFNLTAGEECDDGGDSADCDTNCTVAECGDGYVNASALEDCDDSGESLTCDIDCTPVACGDGVLNETVGEICDDPKGSAACDIDCTAPECGDGLVNTLAGEHCDGDGKGTPGETPVCDTDCTAAECGDGVINEARDEECDDGNGTDEDGCSSFCIVDRPAGESGDESSSSGDEPPAESLGDESSTSSDDTTSTSSPVSATSGASDWDTDTDTEGAAATGDSGCGCSTTPRSSGALLGIVLLALGIRRRRR